MAKLNATGSIVNGPSTAIILVGWGSLDSRTYFTPHPLSQNAAGSHYCAEPQAFPQPSPFVFHPLPDVFKQAALGLRPLSLSPYTSLPLPIHAAAEGWTNFLKSYGIWGLFSLERGLGA